MKKLLAIFFALTTAAALFVGCNASTSSGGSASTATGTGTTLADIKSKGKLIIGLDDTFAPMGFREADGTLVGFDIDLAEAVCKKLGVEAEFQPIDWTAKELELSTGKIDCIWNGMSATPERAKAMSLSSAYLNNKIIVMTNEGITIASKEDLANYNIGVQGASAALEAMQADKLFSSFEGNITEYLTYDEVILDMQAGRLDCMVIDQVFGEYKNTNMDNIFGVANFDFGDDLYAVGFRKTDTELCDAVSASLKELLDEGKTGEISVKWFGKDLAI